MSVATVMVVVISVLSLCGDAYLLAVNQDVLVFVYLPTLMELTTWLAARDLSIADRYEAGHQSQLQIAAITSSTATIYCRLVNSEPAAVQLPLAERPLPPLTATVGCQHKGPARRLSPFRVKCCHVCER